MPSQQGQAFEDLRNSINEGLRIVRHRWRLALAGLSVIGAAAFWGSQHLPRAYSASTLFERRDDMVLQNLVQTNSPFSFEHLKTTMGMDMTGARAVGRGLEVLGLVPAGAFGGQDALTDAERHVLERLSGRYQIAPALKLIHSSPSLDTIQLRCEANDPAVARQLVVALRDNYITQTRDRIRQILHGTRDFFAAEVQGLRARIAAQEGALRRRFEEFEGLDPTDLAAVGNRLETLRANRDGLFQRRSMLEAEIAARDAFLAAPPPADYTTSAAAVQVPAPSGHVVLLGDGGVLAQALDQVQQQIITYITEQGMTVAHPRVRAAYARLAALEELRNSLQGAGAPAAAPGSGAAAAATSQPATPAVATSQPAAIPIVTESYRDWQNQVRRVELELTSLRQQLTVAVRQFEEADGRLGKFEQLYNRLLSDDGQLRVLAGQTSELTSELAVWQSHLSRLERVLAAEAEQRGTQFVLLEEPEEITRPTKPRVASVFAVCSGLGLAAAALLVALAELFDRSFRSVGQVTRVLGLPVLECIATIPTPKVRRRLMFSRLIWVPTLSVLLVALGAAATLAYVSLTMPEAYGQLLERFEGLTHLVGLTAPQPGLPGGTP